MKAGNRSPVCSNFDRKCYFAGRRNRDRMRKAVSRILHAVWPS